MHSTAPDASRKVPGIRARLLSPGLALAIALSLALAPAAGATILPQKGIAGVTLSMNQAKVMSVLGKPTRTKHAKNDFGPYTTLYYPGLSVTFQGNSTATAIDTSRASEKTASGVGVGSTKAQIVAGVKGVKCEMGHCYLGAFLAGRKVTDFFVGANGRVNRVVVGIVID